MGKTYDRNYHIEKAKGERGEWRLAMERYRAVIFAEAKETGEEVKMLAWARDVEYRIMLNLAGLEEPQNAHP